ncbi:MAG: NDP-sugar synthase [Abditibacteriales bacterium]|nr:NDP-sugar synthase [Abditibacteriales bacterium]MDW8366026.1 NDP-sugar synthase [Abditibacteriales bacterium]
MRTAIILGAGIGHKIFPYDTLRQKAALPIANVPIVRRLVGDLRALGVVRFVVVVGHFAGQVREALAGEPNVEFVPQPQPDGTAAAVSLALPRIEDDSFLVAYGDIVTSVENLKALIRHFQETGAEAAALVQPLGSRRAGSWICAEVSGDCVREFLGHPRNASHRVGGVYALRKSIAPYLERNPGIMRSVEVGDMPAPEAELEQSLQLWLEDGREIAAVETVGFHVDVDKPWHILEANRAVIADMARHVDRDIIPASAKISEKAEIGGRLILGENCVVGARVVTSGVLWAGAGTEITNGAILQGDVVIGQHCRVRDYCQVGGRTTLGDHCIFGHGAEGSGVFFDRVYLYHYCEVWGVFGSALDVGAATVCGNLRFDDAETIHTVHGRREIPEVGANAAYFGDYTRTGVNAIIMPGVKVGCYSIVGPGVILYEDVPPRTLVLAKQELIKKPWGPERYGW